jgi:Type II secretion system (T2SS), protein E, N-terminal domain
MGDSRPTIFDILERSHEIGKSALRAAKIFAERWSVSQFEAVLETNLISETRLADAIGVALKLTRVSGVLTAPLTQDATELVTYQRACDLKILPLRLVEGQKRKLELIVADPTQYQVLDSLARELSCELEVAVAARDEILRALEICWPIERQIPTLGSPNAENRSGENG